MSQVWPALEIAPHPLAPTFSKDSNPHLILSQLVTELSSSSFQATESVRQLIREAGFVSLWFYLKFIAGFDGPYDLLNTELHVDMANFRQRVATEPGIKAGAFIPRACYKSTILSHGANSWELLRNPNLRIGCTSQIYDRALSFVKTTIYTFSDNEFHKWLYPEYVKENRSDIELILANRTRRFPEPNLMAITAGGSTQGIHVDVFDCDDINGEDMLNSDRQAGAEMYRMTNWLYTNLRTLVVSWVKSRVIVIGTRYAIDDSYEPIMLASKEHVGYWDEVEQDYPIKPDGEWVTYYRPALQQDEKGELFSINTDAFTVNQILELMEKDPWTAQTQYLNRPRGALGSEWSTYTINTCNLEWNTEENQFIITFLDNGIPQKVYLRDCCVVAAGDPSGGSTTGRRNASKAATAVIARDSRDRIFIINVNAGYVEPTTFFDWLFGYKKTYHNTLIATYVEAQAGFKAMIPILRQEEARRGVLLNLVGIPALGEKETTIRNILQPYFNKNMVWATRSAELQLLDEVKGFPSRHMDVLDAVKIAVYKSFKPRGLDGDDDFTDEDDEEGGSPRRRFNKRRLFVDPITGY